MIPQEQKAKLEKMGVDYVRVAHTLKNDALTTRCRDSYKAGAQAAWDMAVQYEREKINSALIYLENRRKLAYSMRGESRHIHAFMEATCTQFNEILNPPEQKEEGGSGMSFEKWICTQCGAINPSRSYECHNCGNNGNYERIVI